MASFLMFDRELSQPVVLPIDVINVGGLWLA